jgi:hypothetical protein
MQVTSLPNRALECCKFGRPGSTIELTAIRGGRASVSNFLVM